jgi:hypothetical protein
MTAAFIALPQEDQLLLESAAHIGYKFDADILAAIWKQDILTIIRKLESLEKSGFVKDLHEEDNLFSFRDKEMHRVIRKYYDKNEETDEGLRQLVIEYQKRIIDTIVVKGEDYISSLDIDILQSTIQRCFKYSKVDLIRKHTPVIGLYAALKYMQGGKANKAAQVLHRIYPMIESMDSIHVDLISQVLTTALDVGTANLEQFDKSFEETVESKDWPAASAISRNSNFLDDVMKRCLPFMSLSGDAYEKMVLAILLDAFRRRSHDKIKERLTARKEVINNLVKDFKNSENRLRVDFYFEILKQNRVDELESMFNSAFSNGYLTLSGEIARHISLNSGDAMRYRYAINSLLILAGRYDEIRNDSSAPLLSVAEVKQIFQDLFAKENMRSSKASDVNFTISRFRDYFYSANQFDDCIYFCDLGFYLSQRLNDDRGMELALSNRGASLYRQQKFAESMTAYKDYFEWLITKTDDKERFSYVIEGIGLNCAALGDYTEYQRLKTELYEHLLFISKSMKEAPLKFSLINKEKLLKDILPADDIEDQMPVQPSATGAQTDSIQHIIQLLVCLSLADGNVDSSEKHDISESAMALSISLNFPHDSVRAWVNKSFEEIKKMDSVGRELRFKESCQVLGKTESVTFTRAILHLCKDLVLADGIINENEKRLMDLANSILKS